MIYIREDECKKMPGINSLYIKVDYNPDIIKILKSYDVYTYNKKLNEWELPLTCLSSLLDELTIYDDIELNILPSKEEETKILNPITVLNTPPYKHQYGAINYGLLKDKWLLLDAPGLGKTLDIIYLANELRLNDNLEHCLIICGVNNLKTNWKKEIEKHAGLSCNILGEYKTKKNKSKYLSVPERAKLLREKIEEFFIITNIETFRNEEVVKAFNEGPNKIDMIAVDEIHKCKSKTSIQGGNLLKLDAHYKIGMTGTLILNSPLDAYVPLTWIGANKSGLTTFKNYYTEKGGINGGQIIGFKHMDIFKEQLNANSLRRTLDALDDVKIPPMTIINEYIDMDDEHRKFYDEIKAGIKASADKVTLKKNILLSMITRLRQATACPSILTTKPIKSSKVERAVDLIKEILTNGNKVVVMSSFKDTLYELNKELPEYKTLVVTGDKDGEDIDVAKEKFQTDPSYCIIMGTWQKLGTGHTLTAAKYMIHLDTAWNAALYEQTCDRIVRIGTTDYSFSYNLICVDTIDEKVASIIETKQAFGDYLVDDKLTDENINILRQYIEEL